jgi:hypothetical protein
MPLAEGIGEFSLKATSVKPVDLGGGQTRIEITFAGDVTGEVPGQHFGTLTVTAGPALDRPQPLDLYRRHADDLGQPGSHIRPRTGRPYR